MRKLPAILALLCLACGGRGPASLVVGAEEGALGRLSGEVVAQALERAEVPVTRRFDLGGARAVHEALRAGELDVAVETTGFALIDVLERPGLEREPTRAFLAMKAGYRRWGLDVMPRLGWDDRWAVVLRPEVSREYAVTALEQLGRHSLKMKLAVGVDFLDRRDGLTGMKMHYSTGFEATRQVAPDAVGDTLARRGADVGVMRVLDPHIAREHLVVLGDGLGYFPAYEGAPVARRAALAAHPRARAALESLAGKMPTDAARAAVVAIANEGAAPADEARAFLR